jgi:hypothetical protein
VSRSALKQVVLLVSCAHDAAQRTRGTAGRSRHHGGGTRLAGAHGPCRRRRGNSAPGVCPSPLMWRPRRQAVRGSRWRKRPSCGTALRVAAARTFMWVAAAPHWLGSCGTHAHEQQRRRGCTRACTRVRGRGALTPPPPHTHTHAPSLTRVEKDDHRGDPLDLLPHNLQARRDRAAATALHGMRACVQATLG